ncbi:MAG: hypothetical protein ACK4V7_05180 [Chitinophagaceae bacterium]|jgi:hypothetical protein|nr:hypothetical protein [Sediminibacterium sp.]
MKQVLSFIILFVALNLNAQITTIQTNKLMEPERPWMIGGGLVLGGGSGSFQIGINPEMVKSYNDYIDLGVISNIFYSSFRTTEISSTNEKFRKMQFGLGGFARLWPVNEFFLQVQPEYNWTWAKQVNVVSNSSNKVSVSATSVLAGIGYGKRTENGFSYFSIMLDLINSQQSPYGMGQLRPQPIFRAGFGLPIRITKKK